MLDNNNGKKSYVGMNKDKFFKLYLLFLLLYFFLALSPLTSADILDYHNGVAQIF